MSNVLAIFWKEMRSYFGSPIAYVIAGGFLVLTGYFFQNIVLSFHEMSRYYAQQQFASRPRINVNELVVTRFFGIQFFTWLIVTPMLTMRLYAEEKRSGTIELLMTSPVTIWQTLLGKFFACFGLYVLIEIAAFALIGLLSVYADLDWGPILSACLAVLLLGATFISAGILASSLTENQIVAVVISFFLLLLLWMIDWSAQFSDPVLGEILRQLSILEHMRDMNRGVIDTSDVVFFLSATVFFLFLTHTVVESRRWRQ